jgi:hypothetical protein
LIISFDLISFGILVENPKGLPQKRYTPQAIKHITPSRVATILTEGLEDVKDGYSRALARPIDTWPTSVILVNNLKD